jgi:hypothetical protein
MFEKNTLHSFLERKGSKKQMTAHFLATAMVPRPQGLLEGFCLAHGDRAGGDVLIDQSGGHDFLHSPGELAEVIERRVLGATNLASSC